MAKCKCCEGGIRLIYACSGASDVGEISDRVARELSKTGFGSMSCLAAIGSKISGFVQSSLGSDENIAIDGCSIACAKKVLELAKAPLRSIVLTDLGYEKGKTPVTKKVVSEISEKIKKGDLKPVKKKKTKNECGCK